MDRVIAVRGPERAKKGADGLGDRNTHATLAATKPTACPFASKWQLVVELNGQGDSVAVSQQAHYPSRKAFDMSRGSNDRIVSGWGVLVSAQRSKPGFLNPAQTPLSFGAG